MTQHEREEFCNLLAKGRGLPPVYDFSQEEEDAYFAEVAADLEWPDERARDAQVDQRARDVFRAR